MEYIADLHVHSKYAGACSESLTLENINHTGLEKGIGIIGTGDFTHPSWISEMKTKLEEENEVYKLKGTSTSLLFIPSAEVCTISKDGEKFKKIHHGILAPDIAAAESINDLIKNNGDLRSDGRPILNITPEELVEKVREADKKSFVFSAHAWTPWFGVFGSYGYASLKEAYGDQYTYVKAIETGLSSDPSMNWRVSRLDNITLISGSDAHSLPKLGREAIVLEYEDQPEYKDIISSITKKKILKTIEFFPEEGKYHYDGHRKCGISLGPEASKKYNGICPVCRRKLTMGVMHRVEELADRKEGYTPKDAIPFVRTMPLMEIIAYTKNKTVFSEAVKQAYDGLIQKFGSEFRILLDLDLEEMAKTDRELASAIGNIRSGKVAIIPGYDGVFGKVDILNRNPPKKQSGMQKSISDFR